MPQPQTAARRKEKPRPVPLSPEVLARRAEIVAHLKQQIEPLSSSLRSLSTEERRAIFYKLEHEVPITLTGTGLSPVAAPSQHFTLAVPRDEDLTRLVDKLDVFASATPRNNVVPHSLLATSLRSIQVGHPTDRLSQELLEAYPKLIRSASVIFEVEMLSFQQGSKQKRDELMLLRHQLKQLLDRDSGIGALFEHEEIKGTCRAVIRCTGKLFRKLVQDSEWQRKIYWFEARPEFETFHRIVDQFDVNSLGDFTSPDNAAPVVCVVDSGVTAGNPFLRPVVREGMLRSFLKSAPEDPSDGYGHGSAVASLVAYHSLNPTPGASNTGKVWIAGARILTEENELEEGRLFSIVLKEVVEHFAPKGVKIFNLSVNVRNVSWNKNAKRTQPRRSWVARTIDQLSLKYDVVFVVSTGNITPASVRDYQSAGLPYPKYFEDDGACMLDPAQAALALTVGSIASSSLAVGQVARARAIALPEHPSPFTRSGPGVGREIKPEVTEYGGNYLLDEESGYVRHNAGLGVAVASHQLTPALRYDSGTSLSAPRVAHRLALINADLAQLGIEPSAALLKAFLVNSALEPMTEEEREALNSGLAPEVPVNVLGYGRPSDVRATYCDDHSVVLFYQGEITPGTITFLDVPVPGTLVVNGTKAKRLTVTVSFTPEVQRWGLEQYLGTILKWRVFRGDVSREELIVAMSAPDADDAVSVNQVAAGMREESNVPNELPFKHRITRRSRGTVQHDVAEWFVHKPEFSSNNYTLAIVAYDKWQRSSPPPVQFGVVVRLEDTGRSAEIYSEVKSALINLEVQAKS